jgi:Na+/H+ antiporter NhaD/arsenite permease-like protein
MGTQLTGHPGYMPTTLIVFAAVYAGMLLGKLPRLQLDRTGTALLGAIILIATGVLPMDAAVKAIDIPTIALLFALMVLSAQLRLGGFYTFTARLFTAGVLSPARLLLLVVGGTGFLAAIFTNDIVCLAITPVLIDICRARRLDPLPFLLGIACAANVGSAMTLIGNPQNILIGQTLSLSFSGYFVFAAVPTILGLGSVWMVIFLMQRGRWEAVSVMQTAAGERWPMPEFDRWQTAKGLAVAAALLIIFLFTDWPREVAALAGAGFLLMDRRLHSRDMLALVDWQLLVLFIGLFIVNHAFQQTGLPERTTAALLDVGIDPGQPGWFMAATVVLSNLVSNVPAVMLLLPFAKSPLSGPLLAMASTLAGNLLIVGSIANIIVVDIAARRGISINWLRHAATGVPVTLLTLLITATWIALFY